MIHLMSALALLGFALSAQAAPAPELENYLEGEITRYEAAIAAEPVAGIAAEAPVEAPAETWHLRNFFLRIKPYAGLAIPAIAKVQVTPELELLWQRAVPDGWQAYKPR